MVTRLVKPSMPPSLRSSVMKAPVIDLSSCILCEICCELVPDVFRINQAGYVEVVTLDEYPQVEVDDAIKACPGDCIYWDDV